MLSNKSSRLTILPTRSLKKELDYLYARRLAIDSLIASLQDYSRFKEGSNRCREKKSA